MRSWWLLALVALAACGGAEAPKASADAGPTSTTSAPLVCAPWPAAHKLGGLLPPDVSCTWKQVAGGDLHAIVAGSVNATAPTGFYVVGTGPIANAPSLQRFDGHEWADEPLSLAGAMTAIALGIEPISEL